MTTYSWKTGYSAYWNTGSDWTPNGPPDAATADVVIAAAGIYTVAIAAGQDFVVDSLAFEAGGGVTLALDGKLSLAGTLATLTQNSGMIALAGTIAGGTVALDGGVLNDVGNSVITGNVILGGAHGGSIEVAAGQTLTLVRALDWQGGPMLGPGTVSTAGTTTIASPAHIEGGLTWRNSGTVLDGAAIDDDGANGVVNAKTGTFDITGDGFQAFIGAKSSATTLLNAGLLEKTAGTGTASLWAAVDNTGTLTATAGTLELDAGGILNGTIGGTGAGVVQLAAAPGFVTTGTASIIDSGRSIDLGLANGGNWRDSGTINDAGYLSLGNGTGIALTIAATGTFDFTSDDGNIVYGNHNTLTNAGLLAKVGGTGTSTIGLVFTNTGIVDVASGTLRILGGVEGDGKLRIGADSTLELTAGGIAYTNSIAFLGDGATLKIDTDSAVPNRLSGFGDGSAVDLAFAGSASATIGGDTLAITSNGAAALDFVSAASLAGLYVTTGSDGAGGTVVGLTDTTQIAAGMTLDIAKASAAKVTFDGVGALLLDAPSQYTGTIGGLAAGDRIDLQGVAAATKVAVAGTDLVVTRFSGSTFSLATDGGLGGLDFVVTKDASGADSIITAEAVSTAPVETFHASLSGELVNLPSNRIAEVFGASANLNNDTFAGFGGQDLIDLTDMHFAAASFTWAGTASVGTLSITDGVHAASFTLTGGSNFASSDFGLAAGLHGGTEVLFV